jgi:hypothetical protein
MVRFPELICTMRNLTADALRAFENVKECPFAGQIKKRKGCHERKTYRVFTPSAVPRRGDCRNCGGDCDAGDS